MHMQVIDRIWIRLDQFGFVHPRISEDGALKGGI